MKNMSYLAAALIACPLGMTPLLASAQDTAPGTMSGPAAKPAPTPGDATLTGKVAEVFGTKFILETAEGRSLVETGPAHRGGVEVRTGEELTVTGQRRPDNTIEAFMIRQGDGRQIVLREGRAGEDRRAEGPRERRDEARGKDGPRHHGHDGPRDARLSPSEIERIVTAEGYSRIDEIERKGRHYEVEARDSNGDEVEIHIDFGGRVTKVELENPRYDVRELQSIVERAGYEWRGDVDRKGKHYEVDAINPNGEQVELHVDFAGEIYKEKRDR